MAQEVFNRYELKYIINETLYKEIIKELKGHVHMDQHGDAKGYYNIINLYFDTKDGLFLNETINRKEFRQKLRLRIYNQVDLDSLVFLEIKKKHSGVVLKRRTMLRLSDAYEFLYNDIKDHDFSVYDASNTQILGEVKFLKDFFKLVPKVIVSYDRQAFQGIEEDDLRVTFDRNLRKRELDLAVESGPWGDLFMDEDLYVLEIKVNDRVPLWLSQILSDLQCWRQGYSKYTSSYQDKMFIPDIREIV